MHTFFMKRNLELSFDNQKIEYLTFTKTDNPLIVLMILAESNAEIKSYLPLLNKLSERGVLSVFYKARCSSVVKCGEKCDDFEASIKDACVIAKGLDEIYQKKLVVLGVSGVAFAARYKSFSRGAIIISPKSRPPFGCATFNRLKEFFRMKKADLSRADFLRSANRSFSLKGILKIDVNLPLLVLASQKEDELKAAKKTVKLFLTAGIKRVNSAIYPKNISLISKLTLTYKGIIDFLTEVSGNV